MKLTYKIIAGAAATLTLAVAGIVYAHPGGGMGYGMGPGMGYGMGPGPGPGYGMGPGMGGMGPGMGPGMGGWMGGADMVAVAAGRTAELKAALKITPAQETAWKAYEAVVQQQAAAMQATRDQMHALMQKQQPADNADFIALRDSMIKQHDAKRAAHSAALKELYAVLTPEQRAIADRGIGPMGGNRMGRWHPMR